MNPLADDLNHILANTDTLWKNLRHQHIFLTGGTGFFGCWLLESLIWANEYLETDAKVTVLTRDQAAFSRKAPHLAGNPAVSLVQGDVLSLAPPQGDYPYIIHAASEVSARVNRENPLLVLDTLIHGTRRVLEMAKACRNRKLLFISSGAVYGPSAPTSGGFCEAHNGSPDSLQPSHVYGLGKRLAEMLCSIYAHAHGFDCLIARCFGFLGPYMPTDGGSAIGQFIRDAKMHGCIKVRSKGEVVRSYLYAADLVIWLWHILLRGASCRAYNVGSDQGLSIAEMAGEVAACFKPAARIIIEGQPSTGIGAADHYVPSIERARSELQLQVWIPLRPAILKTAASVQ